MGEGSKVQQILGIIFLSLIYGMIIYKWVIDISSLVQNNPGDFWVAFVKYLLRNLASGY